MLVNQITKSVLQVKTPAKLNLFLQVLRKRADGFHDINSLFQAVSLYDDLTFKRVPKSGISLKISNEPSLPTDSDNLIVRAAELMIEKFDLTIGLEIVLTKRIPLAAGLGGGSSDAAATIFAVNHLVDLGLSIAEMAEIGLGLGSDIPFFFGSGQAIVGGQGEKLIESDFPTDYWVVLINPKVGISTAAAYQSLKMTLTDSQPLFTLSCCGTTAEFAQSLSLQGNDFEPGHLESYPEHKRILNVLEEIGAILCRMSGSGPTFFGIFEKHPDVDVKEIIAGENWWTEIVRPVTSPPRE
jgi:4-diphosphocytidyl-2C-methyl-D-erythritol kinase